MSGGEVGGEWWGVGGVIGVGVEVVWGWWVGCDACFVYAEFVEYPTTLVGLPTTPSSTPVTVTEALAAVPVETGAEG